MKNLDIVVLFITLTLFASACKENPQQSKDTQHSNGVLSLDPTKAQDEILLSDLVDSVSYIKLETNANSILGRIGRIIIKDKYIYASDYKQEIVCLFDKQGRFIAKLDKQGIGAGEYKGLGLVLVEDNETWLEVLDGGRSSRRIRYSIPEFELLEEDIMYIPSANSVRKLDNFYYFSPQQNDNVVNGEPTNADIIIVDGNTNTQKILFDKHITTEGNYYSYFSESFTKNEKGELFATLMFNNTFYQLSGWDATPILTVDFGEYGIDNSIGLKSTAEQMKYLEEGVKGRAFFPVLNANTDRLFAISYSYWDDESSGGQYLELKERNKTYHTKKIVDDVTGFMDRDYICSSTYPVHHDVLYDGDYLVDIIMPYRYLEDQKETEIEGIGKITDQDNPVIVMMKLRE